MYQQRQIKTSSEEQTVALGAAIGTILRPGDVVFLEGALGSGKTRLAKGIVSAATGVPADEVVSPTFTLINSFEGRFPVHHADLYRLGADALAGIGLEDTVEEGGALVAEWAEKLHGFWDDPLRIVIAPGEQEDLREIVLEWDSGGSWPERMKDVFDRLELGFRTPSRDETVGLGLLTS
jgi:tRNA threonylcarbamoyladenosine biosynthesis protein TsaE